MYKEVGKGRSAYNIVELREKFGVEEEVGGGGKLISHGIQKDLRAVVFVLLRGALFALHGKEAQFENVDAVAEEDCFSTWTFVSTHPLQYIQSLKERNGYTYLSPTTQR